MQKYLKDSKRKNIFKYESIQFSVIENIIYGKF